MELYSKYPEHGKLAKVKNESQVIYEFINKLSKSGVVLCKSSDDGLHFPKGLGAHYPISTSIRELIASHFDIDLKKLDEEKYEIENELTSLMEVKDINVESYTPTVDTKQHDVDTLPKKIGDAILHIHRRLPHVVFCGSLGLKLQDKLSREIGDIDIIINDIESFSLLDAIHIQGRSRKFKVGDEIISCQGAHIMGVDVDLFFTTSNVNWINIDFCGEQIKVQTFDEIMIYKRAIAEDGDNKHTDDIRNIDNSGEDDLPF